jgi:hypothetical protein
MALKDPQSPTQPLYVAAQPVNLTILRQARCPQGQTSVKWTPGRDASGNPVVRIRFDRATCQACPARQACTWANDAPHQLTVRPHAHHEAIQAARRRQTAAAFWRQYGARARTAKRQASCPP